MGAEYQQKKGHDLPDSHQGIQLMGKVKTFTENWDSKRHLLALSFPI